MVLCVGRARSAAEVTGRVVQSCRPPVLVPVVMIREKINEMPQTGKGYRRRNTLRHPGYDYTTPGAYFVTICAYNGQCVFGQIVDQTMVLNPLGQLAADCLADFAERQAALVRLDASVIMPNHAHLLLWLKADPSHPEAVVTGKVRKFGDSVAGSLSTLLGSYKSSVTQKAINRRLLPSPPLWQDNFYDHIIRNDPASDRVVENSLSLDRIRSYIHTNPARWLEDQLHPNAPANEFNRTWPRPQA